MSSTILCFFEIWSDVKDRKLSLPSNKGQQLSLDLTLVHKSHMEPQAEESQREQHVDSNGFFVEVLQLPYNCLGVRQTSFVGRSLFKVYRRYLLWGFPSFLCIPFCNHICNGLS